MKPTYLKVIRCAEDAHTMCSHFALTSNQVAAFDTETRGLHITLDRPFLFQFGWYDSMTDQIYAYAVDLEYTPILGKQVVRAWHTLVKRVPIYLGHNVKFDLHMLANYGEPYEGDNLSDTMFYIRYAHDALKPEKGGPPLGLKAYAAQYIDRSARDHERLLDQEKTAIVKESNKRLRQMLGWKATQIDAVFDDLTFKFEDLSQDIQVKYQEWKATLHPDLAARVKSIVRPEDIPYHILDREQVTQYALMDIVWTIQVYLQCAPVLQQRGNSKALEFENKLILPLWEMERVGFKIDVPYLKQAKQDMRDYIIERRQRLNELAGEKLGIGQHQRVKTILDKKYLVACTSTNSETLSRIESDLNHSEPGTPAAEFIAVLQELRTLEKWYATYILRFLQDLTRGDHLYTQINQVGTVSGRVTSDFQQFPKDPIKTIDGREIFAPRKMVIAEGGDYDGLVYLDYSQIELRLQAMYTILVGRPEPNLIGAYAPYACFNERGELFDCRNPAHVQTWDQGWYLDEAKTRAWEPIDVHAATTCYAFGIETTHPEFKKLRYHGKRINFAKNYGAQFNRIKQMFPDYTDEQIRQIDESYYKAFPGVRAYHDYCNRLARQQSYATNMFGIRYYNVSGHNLINMLIQGSSAFFLKWKIRELYEYSKAHGIRSRFQMNIHDELSWVKHKDEAEVFFEFKRIMEDWPDTIIPIVAEMEFSRTTWADKKGVHSVSDLWPQTSAASRST